MVRSRQCSGGIHYYLVQSVKGVSTKCCEAQIWGWKQRGTRQHYNTGVTQIARPMDEALRKQTDILTERDTKETKRCTCHFPGVLRCVITGVGRAPASESSSTAAAATVTATNTRCVAHTQDKGITMLGKKEKLRHWAIPEWLYYYSSNWTRNSDNTIIERNTKNKLHKDTRIGEKLHRLVLIAYECLQDWEELKCIVLLPFPRRGSERLLLRVSLSAALHGMLSTRPATPRRCERPGQG